MDQFGSFCLNVAIHLNSAQLIFLLKPSLQLALTDLFLDVLYHYAKVPIIRTRTNASLTIHLGGKITIYCFICCSQDVKKNMQKGSFIFFRVSLGLYLWPSVMKSHNFYSLLFMSLM